MSEIISDGPPVGGHLLNGWRLIGEFDPAQFEGGHFFLVWMQQPQEGNPDSTDAWPEIAQWVGGTFEGQWRHVDELKLLEPAAFRPIEPPYAFREAEADQPVQDAAA